MRRAPRGAWRAGYSWKQLPGIDARRQGEILTLHGVGERDYSSPISLFVVFTQAFGAQGVMGTVFFSVSKALISFRARAIPRSAHRTLQLLERGNVGMFVTANHPGALVVSTMNSLSFSNCIALGKTRYFATGRRSVCGNYIPRRSVRQLVRCRRSRPRVPFIFMRSGA